jgi:cytochrome c oxidase cbb3-type subunit 3
MRALLFVVAVTGSWLAAVGQCAEPSDAAALGREVYNFRCYYCHGYAGDANTVAATYLEPKPRDFTRVQPHTLSREAMLRTLRDGRPGTAMQSYRQVLTAREMEAVVDFVRAEFMIARARNTRYHIAENGWPNHDRYAAAFPFVHGEISIGTPVEALTPTQQGGRKLYLSACITCHDPPRALPHEVVWESRPLSYPLHGDTPTNIAPDPTINQYHIHDRTPRIDGLSAQERRGEQLFQANCAFCHAADGTGKNWIGSFMEPPARDLTGSDIAGITKERLMFVIREGLPNTSMPAWKEVFKPAEVEAVAAYVMKAFRSADRASATR